MAFRISPSESLMSYLYINPLSLGGFVDMLASRSGYSVRKPSVPMIAILLSSLVGMSIE